MEDRKPTAGLLAAMIAPKSKGFRSTDPKPEEAIEDEGLSKESDGHSFSAVAKAFGIPKERMGSAQAALKQYVRDCFRAMESEEPESEEY